MPKEKNKTVRFVCNPISRVSPKDTNICVIGKQLLRCAVSVGANYRAACRGKSKADFIAKSGTVEEEADESIYWLEMLAEAKILKSGSAAKLLAEANELTDIIAASRKTAKKNK